MKLFKTLLALSSVATVGACGCTGSKKESKIGSTVVINYKGFMDGVAFPGGEGKNYPLKLGSGKFIPGFEQQLVGYRRGDAVRVIVKFPDEYPGAPQLAGKQAIFQVKILKVK